MAALDVGARRFAKLNQDKVEVLRVARGIGSAEEAGLVTVEDEPASSKRSFRNFFSLGARCQQPEAGPDRAGKLWQQTTEGARQHRIQQQHAGEGRSGHGGATGVVQREFAATEEPIAAWWHVTFTERGLMGPAWRCRKLWQSLRRGKRGLRLVWDGEDARVWCFPDAATLPPCPQQMHPREKRKEGELTSEWCQSDTSPCERPSPG